MSIQLENITKYYSKQKVLNAVSFHIQPGEIVGILGTNGAGKSTIMKIITGYIPPSSGKVEINAQNIRINHLQLRRIIGYLPENNALYEDMYVREYLKFIGKLYYLKNIQRKVADIILQTGLQKEQGKKIGALSKGYKQRVGIAQALIHNPEVVILDEPTSGLDPNQIVEIRELIKKIGKEKTIMLSTHILQEVEAICDRVIILNKGSIVADSPTSTMHRLSKKRQQLTVEFNKDIDMSQLKKMEIIEDIRKTNGHIYKVKAALSEDCRSTIFNFAVKNKISILTLKEEQKDLENIFKELTN